MNILVLSIEYPPLGGGASPAIHEINKGYARHGHQVTVITMPFGDLPHQEIIDGIDIIRVKCKRAHKHISTFQEHVGFLFATWRFLKTYLRQHSFELCHVHFIVPTGLIARWINHQFKIPYIVTLHGSDVPGYNPDRFQLIHHFTPWVIRSITAHSLYVVSASRFLQSLMNITLGHLQDKVRYIPNGIDTDLYTPGNKKAILLSTGRLLPRKGFQYLIDVVSAAPFPFTVHICGDGPMMAELQEKAKKSQTPIVFHGWVDNKSEMYKSLLAEATYFSLVSEKENASISLLEALSAGCAVITSDVSGCPESVEDAGICISPADTSTLKTTLMTLIQDDALRQQLQQKARQRAESVFSWRTIVQQYIALFPAETKS